MAMIERREGANGRVRWTMRVFMGRDPETGKRKFVIQTFDRKKDAEAEARRLERMKDQGALTQPSKEPLATYLVRWLEEVKEPVLRVRTLTDYRSMINRYIRHAPSGAPPLGSIRLDRLTQSAFQTLYSYLWKEQGLSPRTIRYLHTILRQALGHAVAVGALPRNPTDHVKPPSRVRHRDEDDGRERGGRSVVRAMSEEEAGRFLAAARSDRYEALWVLLLTGGLRPGEAFALRWEDARLDEGKIHVQHSLTRRGIPKLCSCGHPREYHAEKGRGGCTDRECAGCERFVGVKGWKVVEPKTDRGRRTVVLPAMAVHALREWRKVTAGERLKLGAEYSDDGFIFCNEFGKPLEGSNLFDRNFRRVMKSAGLGTIEVLERGEWYPEEKAPPVPEGENDTRKRRFRPSFRVYDLRHTCATLLLKRGVNPKIVSERLGHSSITLTLDTYSHVLPDMQEGAAEALQAALGSI